MKRCSLHADTAGHCCPGKTKCVYAEQSNKPGKAKEFAIAAASQVGLLILGAACTFTLAAAFNGQCVRQDKINQEVEAYARAHAQF
jgi:hypothetical protein